MTNKKLRAIHSFIGFGNVCVSLKNLHPKSKFLTTMKYIILVSLILVLHPTPACAADDVKTEYEERLAKLDLEASPEGHKNLASWCKRNYPSKFAYHQREYNKYVFAGLEAKLPEKPSADSYLKLRVEAAKLELPDQDRKYLGLWGELKFAEYQQRLKPGDLVMMKQLFKWCEDQKVVFIGPATQLGESILELEPGYLPARLALGHVEWEGDWTDREKLINKTIDIRSVPDRIKVHRVLAENRNKIVRDYTARPFEGMEELGAVHAFHPRKSPDSLFYVSAPGYSPRKGSALVLSLHGGGSGGFEKADEYAKIAISEWTRLEGYVTVAPVATNHNVNSWGTLSNVLEILDALEEICERFNIDRKRIYVTGQSMGGGGTTLWYLCFPELTAASCGRAGWFHHVKRQEDLLGKPILIIQGAKDEPDRLDSRLKFIKTAEGCGGKVEVVVHEDIDHFISQSVVFQSLTPFFEKYQNDVEPDFDVIRAAAKSWLK
jgi:poly(3-hydroxybutyrate) depolymerase